MAKFAELPVHALGRIGAVLLTNLAKHRCRHTEARSRHRGWRPCTATAARPPALGLSPCPTPAPRCAPSPGPRSGRRGKRGRPPLGWQRPTLRRRAHGRRPGHRARKAPRSPPPRSIGLPPATRLLATALGCRRRRPRRRRSRPPQRGPHGVVRSVLLVLLLVDQREAGHQY